MTELRDARLARALEHAPDGHELPSDAARRAIRAAARAAVTPAAARPWWRRWWSGDDGQRTPWSAALASVLLASLVAVLWYDREIPDAPPQSPRMDQPASLPVPPASTAAPVPALKAPAPATPRKAADAAKEKAAAARAAQTHRERQAELPPMRDAEQQPLAKSAPALAQASRRADVGGVDGAGGVQQPAPAAPTPAPRAATAGPAPAPGMRSQVAAGWTHLRIEIDGRRTGVAREQAPLLAGLIDAVAASARDAQLLEEPVLVRIETLRDGQPHGMLELAPRRIRWTARGAPALTGQPDPAQLQALREELARLAGR